jgi:4a-hydroxytetrahydrobiopterin dehydratase
MDKLTDDIIAQRIENLPDWRVEDGELCKDYTFPDFITAMDFMARLVPTAERLNHHPNWSNTYNKISIRLTTHEAGGLTDNDFLLAEAAEETVNTLVRP